MGKLDDFGITRSTEELKKLITENPDLPIVVLVSDDACQFEFAWTYCSGVRFGIDEILDCDYTRSDDCLFTDRGDLEESVESDLYDEYCDKPEEEYEAAIKARLKELEPYWKKAICIWAGN